MYVICVTYVTVVLKRKDENKCCLNISQKFPKFDENINRQIQESQ